jgi:hypothetical protein
LRTTTATVAGEVVAAFLEAEVDEDERRLIARLEPGG